MDTPKYLLTIKCLAQTVIFIVLFSFLFMLVYRPSSPYSWMGFSSFGQAASSIAYYIAAAALLSLSKLLMYRYQRKRNLSVLLYVAWIILESVLASILYIVFAVFVSPERQAFSVGLVTSAFLSVPPIILIPYANMSLWAANRARREEFEMLRLSYKAAMRGQDPQLLHLRDSKGELKISVRSSAIYYILAQDNYVQIFYDMDGEMCSYLLRCSTGKLEEMLEGTSLKRCHRSYIVNLDHVKLFRNEKEGCSLLLDSPDSKMVPVSKTYYKQTLSLIEERGPLQDV